jgi:hypothetical protein
MATAFISRTAFRCPALLAGALATSLVSLPVRAQEATPPTPPTPPPAEAAPAPAPPPPAPAPAPAAVPAVPTPTQAATAAPSEAGVVSAQAKEAANQHKKMDPPAIWFRLDNSAHNHNNPKKVDAVSVGSEVDILFSGEVHEYVAWQADFVATFGNLNENNDIKGQAAILDLIGKFDIADPFHIWAGRMLVPSDRSNFSGPWFMSAWNYPGGFGPYGLGPRQGPNGRNDGATLWGQFFGGYAKYYIGAYDLENSNNKALVSGRLNFTLLNPEPGYYNSSTYYGGKDIVALGLGGQYKKKGSVMADPMPNGMPTPMFVGMSDNYSEENADLLLEKKFGESGVGTLEGAFYGYNGDFEPAKNSWFALASYLIPTTVGIGRFQPLVRYQSAAPKNTADNTWYTIDGAVSYVVDEYSMRIALNYQHAYLTGRQQANAIQIGIQIQK